MMLQKILELFAAKAAITKDHKLGSLNNRDLFLLVLKAGKSKIKVLANSVPNEGFLLACQRFLKPEWMGPLIPHVLGPGLPLLCSPASRYGWGCFISAERNHLTTCVFLHLATGVYTIDFLVWQPVLYPW